MSDTPSTSWATWAWQAYREGRLVEVNTVQAQIDAAVKAERERWITSLAPIKHQVEFYTRRTDLFRKGDQP